MNQPQNNGLRALPKVTYMIFWFHNHKSIQRSITLIFYSENTKDNNSDIATS